MVPITYDDVETVRIVLVIPIGYFLEVELLIKSCDHFTKVFHAHCQMALQEGCELASSV